MKIRTKIIAGVAAGLITPTALATGASACSNNTFCAYGNQNYGVML